MLKMIPPVLAAWLVGLLATASVVVHQLIKPRLPVYKLQVGKPPALKWIQGQLKTKLRTDVQLHNDNFLPIDVHALSFDMFYMDWDGRLQYIGNVQDRAQQQPQTEEQPIWTIAPRAPFSVTDELYMATSTGWLWRSFSRLAYSLWQGRGSIVVPTTGVAQIKASSSAAFTVSIVCDNLLHAWSLQVEGLECALHQMQPGWTDLSSAVGELRSHALQNLRANTTGGVLDKEVDPRWWKQAARRMSWDAMVAEAEIDLAE